MKAQQPEKIQETPLDRALGDRYLSYALSTITARSLPDVRDGLKPVHRRILYAMGETGNTAQRPYRKSASAVGYVMMKYHPHGDGAIYDALVRMAQPFSMRYPLVDGQGNFGSIDGDNAAAMRYTEARLTPAAEALLQGLAEETVDFQPNFNEESKEPRVLPACFPNLLANGATGIAVGLATQIPPHNIEEICAALCYLIHHPNASIEALLQKLPGPDFPTGGVLVETPEVILHTYAKGRGSLRLRARWHVETSPNGQGRYSVVTELPYQVQKARLIERIAELMQAKKLPFLGDLQDESTDEIRLIFYPKNQKMDPQAMMASLFRYTDLEIKFSVNMNALDADGIPRLMNLQQILQAFLTHRHRVLCRRLAYRLRQIEERLELLGGYRIAYLNIEEVIRIIRFEDAPKESLQAKFNLTEPQTEAILNMRLKALRKLEEKEILQELERLRSEQSTHQEVLANPNQQWQTIKQEILDIKKRFGSKHEWGKRRTTLSPVACEEEILPMEPEIERNLVTLVCSEKGWIRTIKGEAKEIKYKEGDTERFVLPAYTTDKAIVFATNGRAYTLPVHKLPDGRGFGEPVRLLIDLENGAEICTLVICNPEQPETKFLVASSEGRGFLVAAQDLIGTTRHGKHILTVGERVKAVRCVPVTGDHVAVIGKNRKLLVFPLQEVPQMTRGRGVRLQVYRDLQGGLEDCKTFVLAQGLSWQREGKSIIETQLTPWLGRRGHSGRLAPAGFPLNNRFK